MSNWSKISLYKFQQIDKINATPGMADLDKLLFSTCVVFDMTEFQLDNAGVRKAGKLTKRVGEIFGAPFDSRPRHRVGRYFLNYEVSKMTFGQFIELSFFLSQNPVQHAHYILASISHVWRRPNRSADHRMKADYFLQRSVPEIMGAIALIQERFKEFTGEYKSLFGLDREAAGDVQEDRFNKRYGWIYSASQVAEYERITLDQAMGLPIRHALNDLAYLKAKTTYEAEQFKKNKNVR